MNRLPKPFQGLLARFRKAESRSGQAPSPRFDRFTLVSWGVTWLIVLLALGFALWKTQTSVAAPLPLPTAETALLNPDLPVARVEGGAPAIDRAMQLKTIIPERPRYQSETYRVVRGDAMLAIAKEFNLKSETLLYVNTQLEDNPHNLRPGMELTIPPVDGLYYQWKPDDTV
ncbi:MAG: LysM peptidoglycan-binding domain-containing protein, partial [Bacteroidota bacterium]